MKTVAVYTLSRTLDLLVMPDGSAQFIRNDRVFRLSSAERKRLEAELASQESAVLFTRPA